MGHTSSSSRATEYFPPRKETSLRALYNLLIKGGEPAFQNICLQASMQSQHSVSSKDGDIEVAGKTYSGHELLLLLHQALWIYLCNSKTKRLAAFDAFAQRVAVLVQGTAYERSLFVSESVSLIPNLQVLVAALLMQGLGSLALASPTVPTIHRADRSTFSPPSAALMTFLLTRRSHSTVDTTMEDSSHDLSSTHEVQQYSDIGDFSEWISQSCHVQALWNAALDYLFFGPAPSLETRSPPSSALISHEGGFILDQAIKESRFDKAEWNLLFSTKLHGQSWTVFLTALAPAEVSLVILRDRDGHVFGALATSPWVARPDFYGNSSNFLFSLSPKYGIYRSTGINSNFQYINHGRQTLPNGLGLGGQIGFFGLWISSLFDRGSSMAKPLSTTFGNPQLSKQEEYEIDFVEVWCIKTIEVDDRLVPSTKTGASILGHVESAALLEMAGKTMYAKDLQEPEPRDE
ncbi:hypothetical protein BASA50_001363 [Batrachochytrium salamandrivorans]|uniref:Oxidation resistance protein 1 n=1 Tax=Batrachochytrium salamandrivorans TaxID=1357716 RepID=A0ABQ8EVG3_9FUNG|nr:hypothetical protein BASA50_001363 [Batrachochytrium salamandrivorans]